MARYVVPVMVLLAMVGGYVVGQQPAAEKPHADEKFEPLKGGPDETIEEGLSFGFHGEGFKTIPSTASRTLPVVGRYVPFEGGRMLDTTNGTLYALSGERWRAVASMGTNAQRPQSEVSGGPEQPPTKVWRQDWVEEQINLHVNAAKVAEVNLDTLRKALRGGKLSADQLKRLERVQKVIDELKKLDADSPEAISP